jgi:hypothetical protein
MNEGKAMLAMINVDYMLDDPLDFGYCDAICDNNRDKFAMMGFSFERNNDNSSLKREYDTTGE